MRSVIPALVTVHTYLLRCTHVQVVKLPLAAALLSFMPLAVMQGHNSMKHCNVLSLICNSTLIVVWFQDGEAVAQR